MRLRALVFVLVLPLVLAACAGRTVRPSLPPEQVAGAELRQIAREQRLRQQEVWSLVGRIAVSTDGNGGSGRIEWRQDGPRFAFALSAPVTRQSWRLTGDAAQARLEGLEGGTRHGPDPRQLLVDATGWDIPVVALADWVRGVRSAKLEPARVVYGADGRPAQIVQGGWQVDYVWPDTSPADDTEVMPTRVDAQQGGARVRLLVDQWGGDGSGA